MKKKPICAVIQDSRMGGGKKRIKRGKEHSQQVTEDYCRHGIHNDNGNEPRTLCLVGYSQFCYRFGESNSYVHSVISVDIVRF